MSHPCQQLTKVLIALCDEVASPKALLVKEYASNGQWLELQKLKVSPNAYLDSESYFRDALCVDFLRKAEITTEVDTFEEAVKTFWACESQNASTNARLNRFLDEHLVIEDARDFAVSEFIRDWRKEISCVLRKLPDDLVPRFGPGSTFGDRGKLTTIPDKMSGPPTITSAAVDLLPLWEETAWCRASMATTYRSAPQIVRGNRFTSVPKTGLTRRGICIEPSFNVSYQLAVGGHIRTCLKRIGIDLTNGQGVHRDRAQASSLLDTDATVDLSNASDTICRILPQLVLDDQWFELLNSLRSHMTLINGRWVRCEKFSSMGNGFTFELETLIFVTLARTLAKRLNLDAERILCYGDDLIVPKGMIKDFFGALAFFGFTPNKDKSFFEGPFRESCGGDFFNGQPVRAHYVKDLPYEPQHWITIANGLKRVCDASPSFSSSRWLFVRKAHRYCLDAIPSRIRQLKGPLILGDIVIHHDDPEEWVTRSIVTDKAGLASPTRMIRVYRPVTPLVPWEHWSASVRLASGLYGLDSSGVSLRDGVSGYKESFVSIYTNNWLP